MLITGMVSSFLIISEIFLISLAAAGTSMIPYLSAGFMFWLILIWEAAGIYILPFILLKENDIKKTFRKSLLLVLDNPGLSIKILLFSALMTLLSIPTFLFIPGIFGIRLFQKNAHRLLMLKYDWLEQQGENGGRVPWNEVLKEERERVGKRSLKGMIFPWKN